MRKILSILMIAMLSLSILTACGSNGEETAAEEQNSAEVTEQEDTEEAESSDSSAAETLVVYFTRIGNTDGGFPEGVDATTSASLQQTDGGLKGNAQLISEWISDETGGDMFAIESEEIYPADYNATVDKASKDQAADLRPALKSHVDNMDQYKTVVIVFPNWWGDLPMPVYSFFDEYDLSGKEIIVYVTHEGSRYSGTIDTISELEPEADVKEGLSIRGGEVADSETEVRDSI
ncbi:MAG: flavodoxin [Mogibacterium sp.]|nr:flavodoxin [Mogibacterium sp.]